MSSGGGDDDWCTIESDPGVFTELLEELDCDKVQLEELWSLDNDTLAALDDSGEIYGLIFLFQWQNGAASQTATKKPCLPEDQTPEGLFFAHQVTTNACATQAILSVVLNALQDPAELGKTLSEFRDFTASFPPSLKGVAISGSETIKKAHNAFGRTDAFLNEGKYVSNLREPSEDVFHFVAYIPKDNKVYELDGLQSGPIEIGEVSGDNTWLSVARTAIQQRMTGDAIKFNLMAVIQDKRVGLKKKQAEGKEDVSYQIEMEEAKRAQWKLENQRRRHNYVPLCVTILKELARSGKMPKLVNEAKDRKRQKLEQNKRVNIV
jgi:ubiquitin carboxyl-terminal hydrolase L5